MRNTVCADARQARGGDLNSVTMSTTKKLAVEIWSDIACPWCYVGKRRFEAALQKFPHAESVSVHWRAFELDPAAPRSTSQGQTGYAERLARKYGFSERR